ncbi:hypothetical protein D3C86_1016000 [compost metagenome]
MLRHEDNRSRYVIHGDSALNVVHSASLDQLARLVVLGRLGEPMHRELVGAATFEGLNSGGRQTQAFTAEHG